MIRFLLLFLRLRWQLARGAFRAASAKGGIAAFGAVLSVIAPVVLGILLVAASTGLAVLGWLGGRALLGEDEGPRAAALLVLRFVLGLGTGLFVIMPAVRASRGSSGDAQAGLTRLLLLPLSRRHLHACEVAANCLDPILILFTPAVLAMGLAVALAARPDAAVLALLSSLLLVGALAMLTACLAFGLQLVLRERRRAERVLLVTMVGLIGFSFVPPLMERAEDRRRAAAAAAAENAPPPEPIPQPPVLTEEEREAARAERRAERQARRARKAETFPIWLQWLPSEAHARSLALATTGRPWATAPSLAWLAIFVGGGWWASGRLWTRIVTTPESSGGGAVVDPATVRLRRLPWVAPETSAVALTTARTFLRTVRGKLALGLTPVTVAFLGFVLGEGSRSVTNNALLEQASERLGWMAIFMSLLSLLPVSANAFASDRAGLTMQALAPISERRLVWGKALGSALIYAPCLLLSTLAASLVGAGFAPSFWLRTLVAGFAGLAFMLPLATWMSILLPKHSDLGSLTQAGNPHQGAQWVVILGAGVMMALVGLADAGGSFLTGSPWGGVAGSLVVALVAGLVAWPLTEAAAGALEKRREIVLSTAQGR